MERLKELRIKNNLTQASLAKIIGVAVNTLSQYENDLRQIPDDIKIKLADYFNVSIDYLLGREEKLTYTVPNNLKDVPLAFSGGMEDLTQDDLDEVSRFIEFLKSKKKDR